MRNDEVIKTYERRARAATSPAKYDKILEEAKALLNQVLTSEAIQRHNFHEEEEPGE